MSVEDDYERLSEAQRLKAAMHHTVMSICKQQLADKDVQLNRMVVAAISEASWKKCKEFGQDLELFAKHAKRSTITADDVKLLVRKSPKLLNHISNEHKQLTAGKAEQKKRVRKPKPSTDSSEAGISRITDVDEDSRQ